MIPRHLVAPRRGVTTSGPDARTPQPIVSTPELSARRHSRAHAHTTGCILGDTNPEALHSHRR